ncbi:MAG TPA: NADH-quinone oxidoreductase subunit F, partial [bacterium]
MSAPLPLTGAMPAGAAPWDLDAYEAGGGYAAARTALRELSPERVEALVTASTLRGRGGAGFPTG